MWWLAIISLIVGSGAKLIDKPPVQVTLDTPKPWILLGEPAVLELTVKNVTNSDIVALGVIDDVTVTPDIRILISKAGQPFEEFKVAMGTLDIERSREKFAPGEEKEHRVRVLYSARGRTRRGMGQMAFPGAGVYVVKIVYPFFPLGEAVCIDCVSNEIMVEVARPEAVDDIHVWHGIQSEDFLSLIQYGTTPKGREVNVTTLIDLLDKYPDTGYRDTFTHAIREYVRKLGDNLQPEVRRRAEAVAAPADKPADAAGP